jgi:hypothetical protein
LEDLAASVLYLGAIGDRYGRKLMLVLGVALSIPTCLLAAYAPNDVVLILARIAGGVAAGMAFPTTLALIAALWSGAGRTRTIALWSAIGGAISSLGPLVSGFLLERFWWGFGLPGHPATGAGGADDGLGVRPGPRQRGDRPGGQPRRDPVGAVHRRARARDQLRHGAQWRGAGGASCAVVTSARRSPGGRWCVRPPCRLLQPSFLVARTAGQGDAEIHCARVSPRAQISRRSKKVSDISRMVRYPQVRSRSVSVGSG